MPATLRVLVLGGSGFVGRHAAQALRSRAHRVVIGTRDPRRARARLPASLRDCELRETHLESLTSRYVWQPLLHDVDVVLNAVGILRETGGATYDRVQHMAPAALALACERLALRLVHVSSLGLRRESRDRGLRSKLAAERAIAASNADYSLVRPSLLAGSGGLAADWLRRIASWPLHPCPADALGRSAALDVRDLGEALAVLCEASRKPEWREVELGGALPRTLAQTLAALRALSDDRPALRLPVPALLARAGGELCDWLHFSPLSRSCLELARRDLLPRANLLQALIGRPPTPVGREPARRNAAYAFTLPGGQGTPVPPNPQ